MPLPYPTKTNYGNVNTILPTEMNNIGLNLQSLGDKVHQIGDEVWVTKNADYDPVGGVWNRIDITKYSGAIRLLGGIVTFYSAPPGANPINWFSYFEVNASIPFGRVRDWKGSAGGVGWGNTEPILKVGDLVLITALASLTKDATPGSLNFDVSAVAGGTATLQVRLDARSKRHFLANEHGYVNVFGVWEVTGAGWATWSYAVTPSAGGFSELEGQAGLCAILISFSV